MKTSISKKALWFMILAIGIVITCLLVIGFISVWKMHLDTIGSRQKQDAQIFSDIIAYQINNKVNEIIVHVDSPWWRDAVKEANLRYENWEPKAIHEHMARMDEQWPAMKDSQLQEWLVSRFGQRLKKLAERDEVIAEIFVTDQYGGLVAASEKTSDFYQADEKWWQRAYNNGKGDIYFGEIELDESSGKISSAIAVPLSDDKGQIIGIAKAVLDTELFFNEMKSYKFGKTGHSVLIDKQGKVIYHAGLKPMSASPLSKIIIEELLGGKHDFMFVNPGGLEKRSLVAAAKVKSPYLERNDIYWISVVSQGVNEIFLPLHMIFGMSLIFSSIISFLLIAIMQSSIKGIFISPLQKIRDGVQRFSSGEQDYKIDLKTGDEIEDLANAFNKMTGQLEKTTVSRDYLDNIMGSMTDSLIVIDPKAKIATVNKATCVLLGYEEGELVGKDVSLLFSEEEEEEEEEEEIPFKGTKLKKLFKEGTLWNYEANYKTKDARLIPVILSGAVLKRKDCPQGIPIDDCPSFKEKGEHCEKILGAVCIAKDITELKKTEEEREKTMQWQHDINALQQLLLAPDTIDNKLKSITDGIVRIFDADFCRIWLIRRGDICEQGCIHAEVKEGLHICHYRDKCLHLMASSGRYIHINGKGHARVPFGCYKIGLVASGEEHKFLTNKADNDPHVHNHEWARELGLVSFAGYQLRIPGRETIGVLALFAKHPILQTEDAMLDTISSTAAFVVEESVTKENMDKQTLQLDAALKESLKSREILLNMLNDNNQIREEMEQNIVELKIAHSRLKETQSQLIQSEKLSAVGRLASGVAHEVKNPLAIIMQSAEYLTNKVSPEHKEIIQMMVSNIKRADIIVRTLVDFSRMSELKLIPEDINIVLESSLILVQHRIRQENIKIIKEFKEDLPKVLVDKNKIEQVFVNLLLNAIQAMPKGGNIFIRTHTAEFEKPKEGIGRRTKDFFKLKEKVVMIEIEDMGEGIKEENLDKIFEPFFTTKEPGAGTGLGLAVTGNIIAMHKALIEIKSKAGEGTRAIVILKTERESYEQEKGIDS
jgi:PAS domain S-box-containing protein